MSEHVTVPEPENVPAELRERDQWLMWDADAEKPRRPHWRGDFSVSYTNTDDWHTFEEAHEAASERDSWGIGYVFAYGETDKLQYARGLYGGIDIDGAYNDNGRAAEWVPSMEPFGDRNAWIERSPSGDGLHILLAGFSPPEWWSDVEHPDQEHTGVEAYDVKFFTVTGDRLEGAGDEVADAGEWVNEWLREAYKSLTGTDPLEERDDSDDGEESRTEREEWLEESHVRDALEHIDPDASYPLWRDIGFALADHFGDATALSIYRDWSRSGTKWDADAERQAERIINDATTGGGRTIGTVIHHAREGGWSMPTASADGGAVASSPSVSSAERERGMGWETIRDLFRSNEKGTSGEATQASAMRLLEDFDLVTVEENDKIWRYDPETGTFSDDGIARLRKRLADGLNHTYSRSRVTDILHRVRSETYVKRDALGAPKDKICVADGVVDLSDPDDPELLPHSPEYRFTWAMNAPYDPDAEATRFRWFLGGSARPEDIPKLQEYAGDALRHWKQPRNLCVLLGPTDAGKGVFMRVLRAVFGDDNVASETLHDLTDTRWGAHSLRHRPINLANELSTGTLDNPEKAKNFSGGGDKIPAEDKGESKYEMEPTANHLFATNQVPQVSNADGAFYNRWLFVTFPTSVPTEEQDDTLDTRITESDEERAGILNWLIEGYARRQTRTGTGFDGERSIAEKEDMWSAYGTSIDRFISTCITTDDATTDDALAKKDAYAAYKSMCNAVGVSVESQQKLTAELKKEEGVGDSQRKVEAHFDERARAKVYTGVQYTDDGQNYLSQAVEAQRSAEARADTDEQQTGLEDGDGWDNASKEIAQERAVKALLDGIDDMTDEGRGDPVPIEDVAASVVIRDDRARHMIRKQIENGALLEEPEGHVLPN